MNQNKDLLENILDRTFFTAWKNQRYKTDNLYNNYRSLELQINANCNLSCKYCYYDKYKKDLYPADIAKPSLVLHNTRILLNWLEENNLFPEIELFSGEPLVQPISFEIIDLVLDWYIENNITDINIGLPTNSTFILNEDYLKLTEQLIDKATKNNLRLALSISDDGWYCSNENRPFKDGTKRDEEFYDKLFKLAKKHCCAFHPMVYSNKIELWKDNFLWFQEQFKKYDIPWQSLYLLEVRNVEWTVPQIKEFYKFIRFVVNWTCDMLLKNGVTKNNIPRNVFDMKLFNIFNMFSRMNRGIGCSIQSTMQLRLGDLTTTLCHRNAYEPYNLFKFEAENDKIVGVDPLNIGMMISMYSADANNFPFCETCSIKNLCNKQCLGAMFEVNKNQFIPIPTVCLLEHAKTSAILDELIDLGLLAYFYDFTSKKYDIKMYLKYFSGDNKWN